MYGQAELNDLIDTVKRNMIGGSIRQTAWDMGISHATLLRFLDGNPPSFAVLLKICYWSGIHLDRVFQKR